MTLVILPPVLYLHAYSNYMPLCCTWNAINNQTIECNIKKEKQKIWHFMTFSLIKSSWYWSQQLLTIHYIVVAPKQFCSLKIELASETLKESHASGLMILFTGHSLSGSPLHHSPLLIYTDTVECICAKN